MQKGIVQVGVAPSGIGLDWLDATTTSPDWTLVGVVDAQPAHLRAAGEKLHLPPERLFNSIAAAAAGVEFDACVLVTPSPSHAALCDEALDAGKHVIVEKPFTTDLAAAHALADRADALGLRLVVDQNYRYMTVVATLRRALRERLVGAPSFAQTTFDCSWPGRPYQLDMDDTMLLEMAIHHFDMMRDLFDADAATASGHTWRPVGSRYSGDTVVSCSFTFANGVEAAYHGSLASPGLTTPWPGVWRIDCTEGALHLADLGEGYGVYRSHAPDTITLIPAVADDGDPAESSLRAVLRDLAAALDEGRRPRTDARDNLRTLAMAFAVAESSRRGRPVDLMGDDRAR